MSTIQAEIAHGVVPDRKESPPPDSWELADVDLRLKNISLKPCQSSSTGNAPANSLANKQAKPTSAWDERPLEHVLPQADESSLLAPNRIAGIQDQNLSAKDFMVDSFLFEALQNPRDRLAVLRMEQEVLKFLKDPQQLLMEFPPMPTSYHRAAAHRVAQHYYLVTTAAETGDTTTVVARKPAIGGQVSYPPYKLLDIPVKARSEGDGPLPEVAAPSTAGMTAAQLKLAIMQRPKDERKGGAGEAGGLNSSQGNSTASVEKRQEEYNKARARIFNSSANSLPSLSSAEGAGSADGTGSPAVATGSMIQPGLSPSSSSSSLVSPGAAGASSLEKSSSGKKKGKGKGIGKAGEDGEEKNIDVVQIGGGRKGKHVAILRDKDKERLDPDYRRGAERFGQRFDPGFGVGQDPASAPYLPSHQPLYAPAATYNTEFPSLGASATTHQPSVLQTNHHSSQMLRPVQHFPSGGVVAHSGAPAQRGGQTSIAGPHSGYGQAVGHNPTGHTQGQSRTSGLHAGSMGHPQQGHVSVPMPWAVPGVMGQGYPMGVSSPAPHADALHYGMGHTGMYGIPQSGMPAFPAYGVAHGGYYQGAIPTQHYGHDLLRHGPYSSTHMQQNQQPLKPGTQGNNIRQQKP